MPYPPLKLKKNEDRRLRAGHLWVYSNEVDTKATPLRDFEPGQVAEIQAASGKPLGIGYVNPNTLICTRLVGRDVSRQFDHPLINHRLQIALSLRERLFDKPFYRLVYGEADALPGLVIDRFGDLLVVQITTVGMERAKKEIIIALEKVLKPKTIVFKNDTRARETEGLSLTIGAISGGNSVAVPEIVELEENSVIFEAPLATGQKTGWFYDHRMNRQRMACYVAGKRVLDVFSYVGGWGIQALAADASEVFCVDSSSTVLDFVDRNATRNGFAEKVATVEGDAFEALRGLRDTKEQFDVVIVDPPAFIKRKKDLKAGIQAYRRINELAMRLLNRDGILISASCSHHLQRGQLQDQLLAASRHIDRDLMILEEGHQSPDHPIHPAIPETGYIKNFISRVLPTR